jgi:hypothetical protein
MSYLSRLKQLAGDQNFTHSPPDELTKPPKAPFVSSVSTVQGAYENISANDSAVESLSKVGAGDTATAPMTAEEEQGIRAWLAVIEETDPATIAEVMSQCQRDADARDYFTGRAAAELPKPDPFPDDRRTCDKCANLIARRCQAAKRGEIVASRNYEPIRDLPRRCEGYAPGATDTDRRPGRERWPGLREVTP